jgi:tetratricopeptide (TPR) repeat protein
MSELSDTQNDDLLAAPLRAILPYWVLALVVFFAYSNIYDNVFLFDDDLLIKLNSFIHGWGHIGDILTGSTTGGAHIVGGFYRPLQILLYALAFNIGGGGTFWFHALNLALHIANTCLVYRLGIRLRFNPIGAFLAALIWGLHPLHTEAVTYMSATADPLFAFFCLWAVVVLLPDISSRKIWMVLPLFLLGIGSKETTVMFPLLVMACLFYINPARLNFRIYLRTWPLWAVSLIYTFWRTHTAGFDGPQTYAHFYGMPEFASLKMYADQPLYRLYTFFATLPNYLELLVRPMGLHMERSFPVFTSLWSVPSLTGLAIVVFAAAHIIYSCRSHRGMAMSFGLLWFAAAHAPDTGLLVPMNALFLEHWMYLPSVGLFLGVAQTLVQLTQDRSRFWAVACVVVALGFALQLSVMTYDQNKIWRDPSVFYNNIFVYGENSARARNNLALYYSDHGQYDESVEQFNEAIKSSDSYAETRYNLALTYLRISNQQENVSKAIENLQRSIEIEPGFYRSYQTLGDIYGLLLHDQEKADSYHAKAEAIITQRK